MPDEQDPRDTIDALDDISAARDAVAYELMTCLRIAEGSQPSDADTEASPAVNAVAKLRRDYDQLLAYAELEEISRKWRCRDYEGVFNSPSVRDALLKHGFTPEQIDTDHVECIHDVRRRCFKAIGDPKGNIS